MVVDTSALLAALFQEQHGPWVTDQLDAHRRRLRMSTVNLAEALIAIRNRHPSRVAELEARLDAVLLAFVPPDENHARLAAAARARFPLNFGDCFAYALAKSEGVPLLAVDDDFRNVDCEVLAPPAV
jgi:ribonuclease VapC